MKSSLTKKGICPLADKSHDCVKNAQNFYFKINTEKELNFPYTTDLNIQCACSTPYTSEAG